MRRHVRRAGGDAPINERIQSGAPPNQRSTARRSQASNHENSSHPNTTPAAMSANAPARGP